MNRSLWKFLTSLRLTIVLLEKTRELTSLRYHDPEHLTKLLLR